VYALTAVISVLVAFDEILEACTLGCDIKIHEGSASQMFPQGGGCIEFPNTACD
jgi:hypothetical protein